MNLQRRTFGTMGGGRAAEKRLRECGQVIDLEEEILRRRSLLSATRPWKPHPGRVYNFPIRRAAEEK